jgi:hypothetical protein
VSLLTARPSTRLTTSVPPCSVHLGTTWSGSRAPPHDASRARSGITAKEAPDSRARRTPIPPDDSPRYIAVSCYAAPRVAYQRRRTTSVRFARRAGSA